MTLTSTPADSSPAGGVPPAPLPDSQPPRTHLPIHDDDAPPPLPRRVAGATADERFAQVGAWVAALGLAWLITKRLLPADGIAWLMIAWFVLGLVTTVVVTGMVGGRTEIVDRVAAAVVTGGALLVGLGLASTILYILQQGWRPLTYLSFWTTDMSGYGPRDPISVGGVLHAMVGSMIELGIAIAVTVPLGIGTAIFMTEVGGRFARLVRTVVEAMTALPSIVAGLFIYTTLIVALGVPRSGFAAGMAISVMMLPIIARAADVVLRVVPSGLREASLALGASRWRTVWHVVLPTARPGLATALILGVARGVGETSPVLLTSGAASFLVVNPTDGVMNSLPLFIFDAVRSGEPILIERAYGAAAILLILVLTLFVAARLLARPRSTKPPRPRRRRPLPRRRARPTPPAATAHAPSPQTHDPKADPA